MRDIKDWCISRQIWWGHQIPAWYCRTCNKDLIVEVKTSTSSSPRLTILQGAKPLVGKTAPASCPTCGTNEFIRDPDVLDTWFSSGLWPFSTLGWPKQTAELRTYYPTSTLVTGLDILFFWVARMIMLGLKIMGDVPFRDVYIHALVRDAEGQKMSKSKGNVIDPLHVMEEFGTDALRFTLASMASPGRDIKLAEERIEGYRNFANKIWNAARFILMNLDGPRETVPAKERSFADQWILSLLNRTIGDVTKSLELYRFDQASSHIYQFIWRDYCDWYLEMIKPSLQNKDSTEAKRTRQTLVETFETVQRLLHPFMPFISEEIWHALPHEGESIVTQPYPILRLEGNAEDIEDEFGYIHQFVMTIRTMRALLSYQPGKTIAVFGTAQNTQVFAILQKRQSHIAHLGRAALQLAPVQQWPAKNVLTWPIGGLTVGVLVEGDVDLRKALDRSKKERDEKIKELSRIESKLNNHDFKDKAPSDVVAEHTMRLQVLRREHDQLSSSEQQLRAMLGA
jgi:valyl-tRNA synthetase